MPYEQLDNEELLRIALDAVNQDRHADAVSLLKTLLERDGGHVFGTYLLAAEHAQLGMMERAEVGFTRTVALAPDFPMARFQLGQLHLGKGDSSAARNVLAPLLELPAAQALPHYARALLAAADADAGGAVRAVQAGLACEQDIPALASDMQRVLANLLAINVELPQGAQALGNSSAAAPMFLSNYGKAGA